MVEDVVRALGFLCLGTRLKRIGERLQAETQTVIDGAEMAVQSSQFPFLAALDRLGPLAVGELAEAIGISQPGVTRSLSHLVAQGLVETTPSPGDQRRKMVSLTGEGQRLVDLAKADVWPRVESAVASLCAELDGPLLAQLGALEDGLAAAPLQRRARRGGEPDR